MESFNLLHAKALYLRFCVIYGDKFSKPYHDDDFKSLWYSEWSSGLDGIDVSLIKGCLENCKSTLEWPPSIAEFRKICEQSSGLPSYQDALSLAIRQEFSHPVVKMAYDKVGSWVMRNSKEVDLNSKFKTAYQDSLHYFRTNSQDSWKQLEEFKAAPSKVVEFPKILSKKEFIPFKKRYAEYLGSVKECKENLPNKEHPIWDKKNITSRHREFDRFIYNKRKEYLLGVDEYVAGTLSREDWFDRNCYMCEAEALERIYNNPCRVAADIDKKDQPRPYSEPRKVYKNWMHD